MDGTAEGLLASRRIFDEAISRSLALQFGFYIASFAPAYETQKR